MTSLIPVVISKAENIFIRKPTAMTTPGGSTDAAVKFKKVAAINKLKISPGRTKISKFLPEERHRLIELAAYYFAAREKFQGTFSHNHWLQAEREIDAMIASGKFAG